MPDRRIRIPKDKQEFIKSLLSDSEGGRGGPFETQAHALTFAAAFGAEHKTSVPFEEGTAGPIRYEIFENNGLDIVINLLGVQEHDGPEILANSDEMVDKRVSIFEYYANGGLQLLQSELKGQVDITDAIFLMIAKKRRDNIDSGDQDFDLTQFVP